MLKDIDNLDFPTPELAVHFSLRTNHVIIINAMEKDGAAVVWLIDHDLTVVNPLHSDTLLKNDPPTNIKPLSPTLMELIYS